VFDELEENMEIMLGLGLVGLLAWGRLGRGWGWVESCLLSRSWWNFLD
jgi:hypothetical protein